MIKGQNQFFNLVLMDLFTASMVVRLSFRRFKHEALATGRTLGAFLTNEHVCLLSFVFQFAATAIPTGKASG